MILQPSHCLVLSTWGIFGEPRHIVYNWRHDGGRSVSKRAANLCRIQAYMLYGDVCVVTGGLKGGRKITRWLSMCIVPPHRRAGMWLDQESAAAGIGTRVASYTMQTCVHTRARSWELGSDWEGGWLISGSHAHERRATGCYTKHVVFSVACYSDSCKASHLKLRNSNPHNVKHSLISRNPRERMFVLQIPLLIVTFLSLISSNLLLMQTTQEVNPHSRIASCVNKWSVVFFFFFFLCHLYCISIFKVAQCM